MGSKTSNPAILVALAAMGIILAAPAIVGAIVVVAFLLFAVQLVKKKT